MFEKLKECNTATEMVLQLLLLKKNISANSAVEALKDHPKKPGARGLSQALARVHTRLESAIRKERRGLKVYYSFILDDMKKVSLEDLLKIYNKKVTLQNIYDKYSIFAHVPAEQDIADDTVTMQDVKVLDHKIEKLTNVVEAGAGVQRLEVHFYIHFGKEG